MCSISGFISDKPLDRALARKLCTALLYYGAERGEQSAGAFVNGKILKRAMSPEAFAETSAFFNLFETDPSLALLHTRQPTCGGTGDKQAQPFRAGNTVSIHNGWFPGYKGLTKKWKLHKKSGVDSELVARFVEAYGIKLLPSFLEDAWGPAACAVHTNGTLYLIRESNPISLLTLRLGETHVTVFGSTSDIVEKACGFVWLMHRTLHARPIKEGVLFEVTPSGNLAKLGKPMAASRSWSSLDDYHDYNWLPKGNKAIDREEKRQEGLLPLHSKDGEIYVKGEWRKLTKRERKSLARKASQIGTRKGIASANPKLGAVTGKGDGSGTEKAS